jgi:hypothetical protein
LERYSPGEPFALVAPAGPLNSVAPWPGRKVFLIVDEHPVHTAHRVEQWVARHRRQIRLVFLPGYSPDLNPDDLLNQDVKTNAVGRRRPRNKTEMVGHVRCYLWSTQRRPHEAQQAGS